MACVLMKVVVIGSYAPSLLNFRGVLLESMVKAGHEVIACAPEDDARVRDGLVRLGVEYQQIHMARTGINPLQDTITLVRLWQMFRRLKPDIVLGYTIKPVVYGTLAAWFAGVPRRFSMITGLGFAFTETRSDTDRGRLKRKLLNYPIRWLYHIALSFSDNVFFQNPDDRDLFIRLGIVQQSKVILINGSGVDLAHYTMVPIPGREFPVFLLIARLLVDKGIVEYAQAAETLKKRYPQLHFVLVGPPDRRDATAITSGQLDEWQQKGILEYMGPADDVRPFLAEADVFVLPSYREGTPRTVLEALATGRPVITTDAPGCRETVMDGENGWLVPVRDAEALASAMEKCIGQPELLRQMGQRSYEIAQQKYDVHKVNAVITRAMGLTTQQDENR